jgi:SAM-dependent methyltransferase
MDQKALWNGAGGQGWVASRELLDQVLQPIEDVLVATLSSGRVLDVGCGTGGTTVALARRLGASGTCTGIDISEPMIAAARSRAASDGAPVDFILADAQTYPFERGVFDTVASRFGVMFFDDPALAFANLRRAARPNATLRCVAWRSMDENPFMTIAERAAAPLLPDLPPRRADEPGQFAFADRDRVRGILDESGWTKIEIEPLDVACAVPEDALVRYLTQVGPVGRILQRASDDLRARVVSMVRPAFDPYIQGPEARFTAACWMIGAHA